MRDLKQNGGWSEDVRNIGKNGSMSTSANFVSVPTASNHKDAVAAIIIK